MSVSSLALSHSRCVNIADKVFNGKTMKYVFLVSDWDLKGLGSASGLLCSCKYWLCSLSPVAPDWLLLACAQSPHHQQYRASSAAPIPAPAPVPHLPGGLLLV